MVGIVMKRSTKATQRTMKTILTNPIAKAKGSRIWSPAAAGNEITSTSTMRAVVATVNGH